MLKPGPEDRIRTRLAAEGYQSMDGDDGELGDGGSSSRGRKWTSLEKLFLVVVILCLLFIILLSVILLVQHYIPFGRKNCESLECVEVAGSVIRAMNWSVDPCHDFYEFTCGNWLQTTTPPPSAGKWSPFSVLKERNYALIKQILEEPGDLYLGKHSSAVAATKQYFNACMDTTGIEAQGTQPMLQLLHDLGGWPVLDGSPPGPNWTLEASLPKVYSYGKPLVDMGVDIDEKNNTNYIILVDRSGLLYSNPVFYINEEAEKYKKAELQLFEDIALALGATGDVRQKAEDVWSLEHELALIMTPAVERLDPSATYNPMTLQELQDLTGSWLDFETFTESLFGRNIPMSTRILVGDPAYLGKIGEVVEKASKETLANYLLWHIIPGWWKVLPQTFQEAQRRFTNTILGVDALEERWKHCLVQTDGSFPYVTGALFANEATSQEQKRHVESILDHIRETFYSRLPKVSWMDEVTKRHAMGKVMAVAKKIAFPPNMTRLPEKLDREYENFTTTNDAFQNAKNELRFVHQRNLDYLGQPVDRSMWDMSAAEVNAYYNPVFNEMVFPAGILQRVFFDPAFPEAMNYGALGMVMGHELTHGFDNTGRHFDKFGNMVDWWTEESSDAFVNQTQCLVNQYNKYPIGDNGHVNGITTLGENIADNGGLKTAYYAYQSWLKSHDYHEARAALPGLNMSAEQLFFVAFAQVWCVHETEAYMAQQIQTDPHTYARYRIWGVVQNMEEFSDAYSCPSNSPMNPKHKCSVW